MSTGLLYAIILAGGSGTRFWPLSRELLPKQLLHIVGDRSMLAHTLDRAAALVSEDRIRIVTTRQQAAEIRRELQNLGREKVGVIQEPAGRNTAAAIGLAAVHVLAQDPEGVLAVFPADHHIREPERFTEILRAGQRLAGHGWLVTLGIRPTKPETGYGYIQRGRPALTEPRPGIGEEAYVVARFAEKPDRNTAEAYLKSGEFTWNAGIFVWSVKRFLQEMQSHMPDHHAGLGRIAALLPDAARNAGRIDEIYNLLESISVDYGILEKSDRVAVIPADMGWSDVGSWESLREILPRDSDGNVIQGDTITHDTKNSLVRSGDRLVATLGLDGIVVVETSDAVLVCPEGRSQEVKVFAERLQRENRPEARIHLEVLKPWGAYRVLDLGSRYQVKWLDVKPGARLSYQSHEHRSEHWTVVNGTATVTLDGQKREVPRGEHVYIPVRGKHRLENQGGVMLRVVEVQSGDYLGEDDILRYEDDYGR
jgi:mannose-1-phosphate guanylyltransferase/mannose-6-phosphate isomerase